MKKNTAGGLAMLGAAILGGYYLLSRSQAQTTDLGGSGLGTGGSTSLTPSSLIPGTTQETVTTPFYTTPDSMTVGIEDDGGARSLRGLTEISDSGTFDTTAADIDRLKFSVISGLSAGGIASLLTAGGSRVGTKAGASILGRVLGKGVGSAGLALFAGDAYDIAAGLGSINPAGVKASAEKMGGISGVEGTIGGQGILGFGKTMSDANLFIGDSIAGVITGQPAETASSGAVKPLTKVSTNYGMSDTPTLSKPYTGSTIGALNVIADTPVGTTWTNTYSSQKTGTSGTSGSTNTYKASSGQQVALAGISASDYASYLANKK